MANLREIIPAFFVGPNGEPLTPEQIAQRQEVAQSLLQQATDTSPTAGGWASVLAKGVQGGVAGYKNRQADKATSANNDYNSGLLGSLFSGQAPATATPAYPSSVAAGGSSVGAVEPATLKAGLIQRGLPEHVADGFLMNFADESGFNPGINEQNPTVAGSRGGFGLYQLTGPRRKAYESFASSRGLPVDSPDAQMDFLVSELQGPEKGAAEKIFAAPDAGTAAAAIVNNFLRPAEEHRNARANKYVARPQKYTSIDTDPPRDPLIAPPVDPAIAQTTPIQVAGGSDADMAQVAALPATPNPNPTVAEALAGGGNNPLLPNIPAPDMVRTTPSVPMPADQMQPMGGVTGRPLPGAGQGIGGVAYEQVPPVMPGQPMPQPPADVSRVPALSGANGLPVVGPTGEPSVSAALSTPTPAPQVGSVAEALAIRPQADPNDRMVADATHTLQPTAEELGGIAPQQTQADPSMQLQRVLADPRASPQTKQVALGLLQRQQATADRQAAAQIEQQNWFRQQNYQQQQRQNDPLVQAQTEKARIEAANARNNPRGEETFYGNPVPIQTPEGIKYGQIGSKGTFKPIELAEGQTFVPPTKQVDTETEILTVNQAGEVIARQPKQNRQAAADTAGGKVEGETEAQRRIAAPADVQTGENVLDILKQIKESPDLDKSVGVGSYFSGVRGTPQYGFNNLVEQAKSGAFTTAIQQMRGLGALSDTEGKAATAAVTRMNVALEKKDFLKAVDDYEKIVQQGIDKAKARAGGGIDAANAPVRRKFNPATGRIE